MEIQHRNENEFNEILAIIQQARERAFRAVNHELISMYWEIGKYVSEKVRINAWGKSIVNEFSNFVQERYIGIKGFSSQNIWRMKQFYETYKDNEKLSALPREISWTNNVLIMTSAKSDEAREFYLTLTAKNNYSSRELERQLDSMLFERTMISDEKNKLLIAKNNSLGTLRDNYTLEFLNLPKIHKESELREANLPSIRTILKCGGVLSETKPYTDEQLIDIPNSEEKLVNIYWIDL